jgi:Rrf2 family transcriptional regulator, iron-sulfur cluster assembly transcription factor
MYFLPARIITQNSRMWIGNNLCCRRPPSILDEKVRNAIIRANFEKTCKRVKISAHEEYGLRCLVQLARAEADGESLTLGQLAELEGLSVANAGKLMWILNKAGLVTAQRGTKGGYSLARPAADIRLNEVIRILDEDTVDGFCKSHAGVLDVCIHTSDCGIRPVIVGLHEIVQNALSEITLAQLVGTEANVDLRLHQIEKLQNQLGPMRTAH